MDIRLASAEDQEQILKYDRHIPLDRVMACIHDGLVTVLCDAHEIVGVLRYNLFWQTIPFLDLLYLDEAYRGKGYGKQMLGLALRFAFDILKVQKVTLGVLENNPGAYHCYQAAGFRDVHMDEPEYYHLMGEDVKCLELEKTV